MTNTDDVGRLLAEALGTTASAAAGSASTQTSGSVMQIPPFATVITPSEYADPRSGSNPNGSLTSLFAFRQLVDPVPMVTQSYLPGPASTESVYGTVVHGAVADNAYARSIFADAQQRFDVAGLAPLDGTPGSWRAVDASPPDWYDIQQASRFVDVSLDLTGGDPRTSPLAGPGTPAPALLDWHAGDGANARTLATTPQSRIDGVRVRCLQVVVSRAWLDDTVFGVVGWRLPGQRGGYCSSGAFHGNDGVLPLLPTVLVVGVHAEVTGALAPADVDALSAAVQAGQVVSYGPFVVHDPGAPQPPVVSTSGLTSTSDTLFVVGWISAVVPRCPTSGP